MRTLSQTRGFLFNLNKEWHTLMENALPWQKTLKLSNSNMKS
jgi:hypothetical protein